MMRLLIKGSYEQARKALDDRHILTCTALLEVVTGEISAVVDDTPEVFTKIVKWYCEPGKAPFPAGTLLLYGPYGIKRDWV